jgi:phospholipase C
MNLKRREFLRGLAGMTGVAVVDPWDLQRAGEEETFDAQRLPDPARSGIEHVVVVMLENRSFDHLLGWLPGSDGRQRGLRYPDAAGNRHRTYRLAPDYTGCGHPDPDHSWEGGRIQYNGGAMNGFLLSDPDEFPIGYYRERDRPFFGALARHYTTLDRSFSSILGPTFPNRLFQHGAQTDRLSNTFALSRIPTIWDELATAGVSHRYYFSNLPFLGLWGLKYLSISRFYGEFLTDAATGALPAVSFVDPRFTVFDDGTGNDDHPHADVRASDAFLAETFHAVANGPDWPSTVFVVTYDEWGGFFDHVRPPRATAPNMVDPDLVGGKALLGLRLPAVVASPWSRGNPENPRVMSTVVDHTSTLKLIEWRWNLPTLTARDASSDIQNLAHVLNFRRPRVAVPDLPMPAPPLPQPCPLDGGVISAESKWLGLLKSGLLAGWPIQQI